MSRLFGLFSEMPDTVSPALRHAGLVVGEDEDPRGYGTCVAHGAHALLCRRPVTGGGSVDLAEITDDLDTNVLVAHVRTGEGSKRTHDTQPFRFGPWMWATTGQLPDNEAMLAELRRHLPDSLQRNVEGHTASEVLFHLFLSHLRDAGVSTKEWRAPTEKVVGALKGAVAHWSYAAKEAGDTEPARVGIFFANAQSFYAASLGVALRAMPLMLDPLKTIELADGKPVMQPEAWVFADGNGGVHGWLPLEAGELSWLGPDLVLEGTRI